MLTAGLARAGFWIRVGALFIDGLIIAICFGPWVGSAMLSAVKVRSASTEFGTGCVEATSPAEGAPKLAGGGA